MKQTKARLTLLLIMLFSVPVMFAGCAAHSPASASGQPGALVSITKIESHDAEGKTEIVIEGTEPLLQYTSFQLTEPLRLIVDISDADVRKMQNKISVGKGAILDVVPAQMDNTARIEIGLNQTTETRVYQAGGKIVVEIANQAQSTTKALDAIVSETTNTARTELQEKEKATASLVTAVQATASKDSVKVVIIGNGTMMPNTFMVEGKKLVVDIPGTSSKVRPNVIPVRKGGLDKVRVGQHPTPDQKVRVVLDLTKAMTYSTTTEGNKVVVSMSQSLAAKQEFTSQEKAAPVNNSHAVEVEKVPVSEKQNSASVQEAAAPETTAIPVQSKIEKQVANKQEAPRDNGPLIGSGKYSGRRISLDLQDADLINVLRLFGDVANLNMILAPDVKGKVTVRMVNIPWDQAMDIILKMNGLGFALEDNILRIASVGALTREAEEESRAKEAKKKAEDLITRIVSINYSKAGEINGPLKKSLSARGETVVDDRTNTIIIKDIARNVEETLSLIKLLDKPIPQVMIEARIVEATTSFTRDIGVQWGGAMKQDAAHGNATGFTFPNSISTTGGPTMQGTPSGNGNFLVNMPAAAGAGSGGAIGFTFGSLTKSLNLDLILSAMESTGEGKVVSTPRVSALDNKEAKIQQGQSIPYTTSSSAGTAVQFIQANLELTVTPHVTPDNKIFMKIHATKNAPDTSLLGAGGQPSIRNNEATTEILLADGETAVIGGILIIDRGETTQKVPFFADIPLIGWLFRQKVTKDDKRELLIFITPKVIKQEAV